MNALYPRAGLSEDGLPQEPARGHDTASAEQSGVTGNGNGGNHGNGNGSTNGNGHGARAGTPRPVE